MLEANVKSLPSFPKYCYSPYLPPFVFLRLCSWMVYMQNPFPRQTAANNSMAYMFALVLIHMRCKFFRHYPHTEQSSETRTKL